MMWMLGNKDGKHWWHKQDEKGNWLPVTEEENKAYKDYWNNKRDEIAAKVFNDAFNLKEKNT